MRADKRTLIDDVQRHQPDASATPLEDIRKGYAQWHVYELDAYDDEATERAAYEEGLALFDETFRQAVGEARNG